MNKKELIHECLKCICFDNSSKNCKYRSKDEKNHNFKRLIYSFLKFEKFSSKRIRKNEIGFHWKLSDGSYFAERYISHLRKCSYGVIVSEYLKFNDIKILEIGSRFERVLLRNQLLINGCEYFSISASQRELKNGVTFKPQNLPIVSPSHLYGYTSELNKIFKAEFFDAIIGSQSFEHWREVDICENNNINAYTNGLNNCHRILRSGGWFIQDVPAGLHGDPIFYNVQINKIIELFYPNKWTDISVTEWGKEFAVNEGRNKWILLIKARKL